MSIKLSFELQRENYMNFNKFHYKKTQLKKTLITGGLVLIILQVALNLNKFDLIATIISSIIFNAIYFFLISRSLNNTKKIPKDDGSILGRKEIEFSDTGIAYMDKNSSGNFNWSAIKSLQSDTTEFYLYTDANMAIVIPKRIFNSDTEIVEFEEYINDKKNNS